MPIRDAATILQAAYKAHRQGYAAAATALFREILHLHPEAPEADAARFYIDNDCRLPPAARVPAARV